MTEEGRGVPGVREKEKKNDRRNRGGSHNRSK